jgi:hypothetical protein
VALVDLHWPQLTSTKNPQQIFPVVSGVPLLASKTLIEKIFGFAKTKYGLQSRGDPEYQDPGTFYQSRNSGLGGHTIQGFRAWKFTKFECKCLNFSSCGATTV